MIGEIISSEIREINNSLLENFKSIRPEGKMTNAEVNDYWKSEFEKAADGSIVKEITECENDTNLNEIKDADGFYTSFEDRVKNTNLDASDGGLRGTWGGERGNSTFRPSYDYMKETLKEYGIEGIDFVNGEADFSRVADATVKIISDVSQSEEKKNAVAIK